MSHQISFTGSGNLATNLARTLYQHDFKINDIISKHYENALTLSRQFAANADTSIRKINESSDTIIFSVKDDVLSEILKGCYFSDKLLIHTAGSLEMDIFKNYSENYGVLYPLQTFSKDRIADFMNTPVFIEANNSFSFQRIKQIATSISNYVYELNSENRKKLHTAAVFACNFTNHMYSISEDLLKDAGLDFNVMNSLIQETTDKVTESGAPYKTQTGPALRNDRNTMNKHLAQIEHDEELVNLYKIISNRIFESNRKRKK